MRSKWAKIEVEYAIYSQRPLVLLKEKSAVVNLPYEWVEFDKRMSPEAIFSILISALNKVKNDESLLDSPLVRTLGIALLAFIAGWYLRR